MSTKETRKHPMAKRPNHTPVRDPFPEADTVYMMRVRNGVESRWVLCSMLHVMRGDVDESNIKILDRWLDTFGPPLKLVRFKGRFRVSEAAATIAEITMPLAPDNIRKLAKDGAS